jgi:hypothetical protein
VREEISRYARQVAQFRAALEGGALQRPRGGRADGTLARPVGCLVSGRGPAPQAAAPPDRGSGRSGLAGQPGVGGDLVAVIGRGRTGLPPVHLHQAGFN